MAVGPNTGSSFNLQLPLVNQAASAVGCYVDRLAVDTVHNLCAGAVDAAFGHVTASFGYDLCVFQAPPSGSLAPFLLGQLHAQVVGFAHENRVIDEVKVTDVGISSSSGIAQFHLYTADALSGAEIDLSSRTNSNTMPFLSGGLHGNAFPAVTASSGSYGLVSSSWGLNTILVAEPRQLSLDKSLLVTVVVKWHPALLNG